MPSAEASWVMWLGNSVSTAPGEMIVVRKLYGFTSCRKPSEMARTACLVAQALIVFKRIVMKIKQE